MCDSTSDIISHVPGHILDKILMCLPLQDAVRTSLLSRKWRYAWVKLPQLVFDQTFYRDLSKATHTKLMMIIYQVMLHHHGPIMKFTLSLSQLESCSEIDLLILFVSSNDIQDFTLHISKGELYKLPSSLYSCLQLRHLKLRSCILKPPPGFEGFTRLISLDLYGVAIAGDVLSSLISKCPLLEDLRLDFCHVKGIAASGVPTRLPTTLNNLKHIMLYDICFGERDEVSVFMCLIRSCPNLEKITIAAFPGATSAIPIDLDFSEVHGCLDVSLNQLREVDMKNVSGTNPELEFIKFLLAKSPMLDTILIKLKSESVADELRIVKELTRLRRASPQAEMNFG